MSSIVANAMNYKLEFGKKFFIYPILSSIFFLLYWVYGGLAFAIIGNIFLFIPLLIFDLNRNLYIYYLLLPNIALFKLDTNGFALISACLIFLFLRLLFHSGLKINIGYILLLISYLMISLISYYLEQTDLIIMNSEIRLVLDLFLVYSIAKINKSNMVTFFDKISESYIYGTILSSIIGLLYVILERIDLHMYRFEAINSDPNDFSLNLAFSVSLVLLRIYYKKGTIKDLIIIVMLTLFGLMSLSRGFLLSMSVNLVFFIYIFFSTSKITINKKILILLVISIVCFTFKNLISDTYQNIMDRITSQEASGGSGRILIWSAYLSEVFSNLKSFLIGVGKTRLYVGAIGENAVQHNLYLEIFTGKGIIGSFIVVGIYLSLFKAIKKSIGVYKNSLITFIPCFTLAIGFMFLNALNSDIGIMKIFLGFLATNVISKKLYLKTKLKEEQNV